MNPHPLDGSLNIPLSDAFVVFKTDYEGCLHLGENSMAGTVGGKNYKQPEKFQRWHFSPFS